MDANDIRLWQIEEYRALRAEVLMQIAQRRKGESFCVLMSVALLSYAISYSSAWIALLSWVLVVYFWRVHYRDIEAVVKLSTYIATFIEKDNPGLHWESRGSQTSIIAHGKPLDRAMRHGVQFMFGPHPALSLASLAVAGALAYRQYPGTAWPVMATGIALILVLHGAMAWLIWRKIPTVRREGWRQAYSEIRQRMDRSPPHS